MVKSKILLSNDKLSARRQHLLLNCQMVFVCFKFFFFCFLDSILFIWGEINWIVCLLNRLVCGCRIHIEMNMIEIESSNNYWNLNYTKMRLFSRIGIQYEIEIFWERKKSWPIFRFELYAYAWNQNIVLWKLSSFTIGHHTSQFSLRTFQVDLSMAKFNFF